MDQDQHGTLARWGPRGQRLEARVPHAHWKTLTSIAALRHDRIDAPWVIDGPINGDIFTTYVHQVLVPTLAKGDIVILDNLGSHKGKAARRAIRNVGAHLLFLPAYSPDLNPIEQVFAKLKHLMRDAAPRTIEDTWRKAGQLLDLFSPTECAYYLRNSGYTSVRQRHALAMAKRTSPNDASRIIVAAYLEEVVNSALSRGPN